MTGGAHLLGRALHRRATAFCHELSKTSIEHAYLCPSWAVPTMGCTAAPWKSMWLTMQPFEEGAQDWSELIKYGGRGVVAMASLKRLLKWPYKLVAGCNGTRWN